MFVGVTFASALLHCVFVSNSDSVKKCKKIKKVVDKPFEGWYYSQRRRKQDRHNKNNSETIMRIVAIIKTIQNVENNELKKLKNVLDKRKRL